MHMPACDASRGGRRCAAPLFKAPIPPPAARPDPCLLCTQVLKKRKGFARIALQTGAKLVPVIGFGENEVRRWPLLDIAGMGQCLHLAKCIVQTCVCVRVRACVCVRVCGVCACM